MTGPLTARRVERPYPLADLRSDWLAPASEADFALPTIVNFRGLLQVAWGPTGIQNWTVPPTALPTPTGQLYEVTDAGVRRVDPDGTEYRWSPWQIERRHPVVSTVTTLHADDSAVTETLTFARAGRFVLLFGGLCRTWTFADYWNLPPDDVPQLNVSWDGEAVRIEDCKTFAAARIVPTSTLDRVTTYQSLDDVYAGVPRGPSGRLVGLEFTVEAGQSVGWTAAQGVAERPVVETDADSGRRLWERTWAAAFTPGNPIFSGSLPALDFGSEELDRLYAMGVLTLLNSRRETPPAPARARFATGGQAIWVGDARPLPLAYTWGGSEGAPTTSFLWEVQVQAALLARLDPAVLRAQLEAFLGAAMDAHWGIDVLTGRGVGMWYGVNDGALISSAADYLRLTGDVAWLDAVVRGRSVREWLLAAVDRHAELSGGGALADYGAAENILECVHSYSHEVASFNAQAAWCYRWAADWLAPDRAQEFRDRAEGIEGAVLGLLRPEGYFACRGPQGEVEVRTCLDFIYVGRFLGDRVPPQARRAMLDFFVRELESSDWMVALSMADAASLNRELPAFQTFRADHQSTGSYDGWPGLAARVRLDFGDGPATLDWLRRMAATTREGPFGQAHWVGLTDADRGRPATKASFFNGNCYLEACGATMATTLLEVGLGPETPARPGPARTATTAG